MRVIFMRHGEYDYNVKGLINNDPSMILHLTAKGRRQAVEAKIKFEGIEFDAVFVSDFIRARETAEIVLEGRYIQPIVDKRVTEALLGFEGRSEVEMKLEFYHDFFNFKEKGKESWQDVKKRVKSFLEDLRKENYENVLVVTHGWIVQIADEIVNGLSDVEERKKRKPGNCEFVEFEI